MAGGTFVGYNKIRPGAYINFKGVAKPLITIGERGIVAIPTAMSWGAEVTELFSMDLVDGTSEAKIGYTALDDDAQIFREPLKNAYKGYFFRLDTGGGKATKTFTDLVVTAKYAGVVGNDITIVIAKNAIDASKLDVVTLYREAQKDKQTVADIEDLKNNAWVTFSGTGDAAETTGTKLEGGTNGTVTDQRYTDFMDTMKSYRWQTMGFPVDKPAINEAVISYIENLRERFGRKVQAVLYNATADYEGIITVNQGYETNRETITPTMFVAYTAGMTAGAQVHQSNTYHAIRGAIGITYPNGVDPYTDADIENALLAGKMVLSTRQDGVIVVEQDINTLHEFTPDKGYIFSKNRVIRVLDEINNSIALIFEKSYIGKVHNNAEGRAIFKADIVSYMNDLERISAIQNFDPTADIEVYAGQAVDSVIVDLAVQPVDAMEKLYMTVTVG